MDFELYTHIYKHITNIKTNYIPFVVFGFFGILSFALGIIYN